jgi:hypothetical protein
VRTLAVLTFLIGATFSAQAKDLMAVVMKEDKSGRVQVHQQLSNDCMSFLKEFKQQHAKGEMVKMNFEAPPVVNGEVLEVACIHEDGNIESSREDRRPRP